MTTDERLDVKCGHCGRTVRATRYGSGRFLPDPHQLTPARWCTGAGTDLGHSLAVAPISSAADPADEAPHPGTAAGVGSSISRGGC